MTLVSLCSVKGSPGVSTTCVGLAQAWPRPVCVAELDTAGGDLHHRMRRPDGDSPSPSPTLLHYATATRRGPVNVSDYAQPTAAGVDVLFGLDSADRVGGLHGLVPQVAMGLARSRVDVLADLGRFLPGSPLLPVAQLSSVLVVVAPASTEGFVSTRDRLAALPQQLGDRARRPRLAVAVRTQDRHGQDDVADMTRMLTAAGLMDVMVLGYLAEDPEAARKIGERPTDRRSKLARTCAMSADKLTTMVPQPKQHTAPDAAGPLPYGVRPASGTRTSG